MIPTEDIISIVKNTIAASIKCNTHRGYIGWSSCDNICMDMHDCLDMCAETLEMRGYMVALEAATYILVSGVKLASHADSSSGMLTDVIMCTYELIEKCAKEIEKQAAKQNVTVSILVEVNIAEEESKFGIHKEETISLIRQIAALPHIQILGLMTIAPFVENPEDNRTYFRQIHQLSVDIDAQNIDNVRMDILSMGMTGDYMVAIEEGATMVRVGTGIFGERHYQK